MSHTARNSGTIVEKNFSEGLKVLVWGINYGPEPTGIAPYNVALCEYLQERGHDVEMVTSFSYYPLWKKQPEDEGRGFRTDVVNGVPVHRCWHYVPQRVTAMRRMVHEATFVLSSFVKTLVLRRPDVMVVVSPSLLLGVVAWLAGLFKRAPFVFHVQDLQPDAAVGLGMLKNRWISRALYALEAFGYRKAARVSGITRGMLNVFGRKGVPDEKQVYFPNVVTVAEEKDHPPAGSFRARMGFTKGDFLAVYSGNLGVKQGLPVLLEAAARCQDSRVQIVICGNGAEGGKLVDRIAELGLRNVHLLPLQERAHYEEMLVDADICLITQRAGSGQFFFPSKLLTTLAFGKPVLAVADDDSELSLAIDEGNCGFVVPAADADALARALDQAANQPKVLREMAESGREYVAQFEISRVMRTFESVLMRVAAEGAAGELRGPVYAGELEGAPSLEQELGA